MKGFLPYDPGVIPTAPPPRAGDSILLHVEGLPPFKDWHFSVRNPRHRIHSRFMVLRQAALKAMGARAPYRGPIRLDFVMNAPEFEPKKKLLDYADGIQDTLDGSHGTQFTYLPIVYEDDCQVCVGENIFRQSTEIFYEIRIQFMSDTGDGEQAPAGGAVPRA